MMNTRLQPTDTEGKYAIIGAGPSGLSAARALKELGIDFDAFDLGDDVGGLWNINNPKSTVYQSAHLISSKTMSEYKDFPMPEGTPDYPGQAHLREYFIAFAKHYGLYEHYFLNTGVTKMEPEGDKWSVTLTDGKTYLYKGVLIANGMLSEPNMPTFKGNFEGEIIHSAQYKNAAIFEGKRVLVVGAGNSGCDIAVDAVHRALKVDISVRKGIHFIPKYIFGKPADLFASKVKLPKVMEHFFGSRLMRMFTGDPVKFGFPKPTARINESRPVINTLILHHIGQGDLKVKADIDYLDGKKVFFKDGSMQEYDLLLLATGYKLDYPFIDKKFLNWKTKAPEFYLNVFHPEYDNLFILGLIEAVAFNWELRYEQARLAALFIKGLKDGSAAALRFKEKKRGKNPNMTGGYKYEKGAGLSYHVNKDVYRRIIKKESSLF
jgi:cation diffusion facilitator CzcD-associated flavoprotein CzcO